MLIVLVEAAPDAGLAFTGSLAAQAAQGEGQDLQSLSRNRLAAILAEAVAALIDSRDRCDDILDLGGLDLQDAEREFILEPLRGLIDDIRQAGLFVGHLGLCRLHHRYQLPPLADQYFADGLDEGRI